ncbi:uncharacterized protein MKK02DRAFT_39614 [Dioszegia hungarica]|uniref:Uncharacterized protein n=1 Tax=Dioszegia hungarica TaxID=4972 RepID=A0AA38HDS8_9TREE|nr:uncharacterized protein MKK02DRAFT_39614 [Dioszegia hungarica]KAI9639317.1 hypothetical protein MKK02DRAFT_39614 [Dioszegia hungarica]
MHAQQYSLLVAAAILAVSQQVAGLTFTNVEATYWYDTTPIGVGGICAANRREVATWNDPIYSKTNPAIPACAKEGETYASINSNRMIAIPKELLTWSDRTFCGKEAKVFGPDGKEIIFKDGPLFAYEGCGDCKAKNRIDFSAQVYAELCGGTCGVGPGNNPVGFRVELLNNTIF